MPLPKPEENEGKKDWVKRCMGDKQMVKEFDQDQRRAVCEDRWERRSEL